METCGRFVATSGFDATRGSVESSSDAAWGEEFGTRIWGFVRKESQAMKYGEVRLTRNGSVRSDGRVRGRTMNFDDRDNFDPVDPRLEGIDRLLSMEAESQRAAMPVGLAERAQGASVGYLPRRAQWMRSEGVSARSVLKIGFSRRMALAACMGLAFIGGLWVLGRDETSLKIDLPVEDEIVQEMNPSENLGTFLTPVGDEEWSAGDDVRSVIERGDAEFRALEQELSALESALALR